MINIVAYCPGWNAEFQQIAATLRAGLGDAAVRIDHIESTSVPQLCAKNVIEVQITVARFGSGVTDTLRHLGFVEQQR